MTSTPDYRSMLAVALAEARLGLKEGGIPIGAAIFDETGKLIGAGHNAGCSKAIRRCTERPTRSETRAGKEAIAS